MLKVSAMALEPSLWGTLPEELLHLVFARLPVAGIGQLRVLSKEWKWNIDCKDSEFNRVFDATTHLKMCALISWAGEGETFVSLYDMQANKWHIFETNTDYLPFIKPSIADGGLLCIPWEWQNIRRHFQIGVVNPLTQRKMKLPPLLSVGVGDSDVQVKMVQFAMDRKTKEYKLHVVGYMKTGGNGLFAQVYDSHINGWSVVESREGRIIGWEYADHSSCTLGPCVYNCANGNLQHFYPSEIAPGLMAEPLCTELIIYDHLFVLHKEAPPGSTNLVQDGECISGKYCISEFHLPEKATAWVKLGVHECDPSIYDSTEEDYELSLLACNGFLLVLSMVHEHEYDRVWLYNLSTCAWRNLTELEFPFFFNLVLCEISWSAVGQIITI